jgi:hypothetical protein
MSSLGLLEPLLGQDFSQISIKICFVLITMHNIYKHYVGSVLARMVFLNFVTQHKFC